ncbi:MAG: response regulator [Verrucomicrobia bacterium]|nr:response regulator [Verrucomicrobiota bacterium]
MTHILVIDDDISIQLLFGQYLKDKGYSVALASDGKEGLRQMHERKPDLIITDIMMPEMDGLEIIQELRKNNPALPVIAISGGIRNNTINFLPIAKKTGAYRVLEKPIELARLLETVQELTQQ